MGAIQLGFVYGLVAIAVLLSFRMINFPDLSVDGSFPLGAAVCATMILGGWDPWMAIFCAMLAGAGAGAITAFLSENVKILDLLSGILTMTALYSVNIRIMGRPNQSLLGKETIVTQAAERFSISPMAAKLSIAIAICVTMALLVGIFLASRFGLSLRAVGTNANVSPAYGISKKSRIYTGLSVSNCIAALAGAVFCQLYGFADVSMGVGTIVIGLAAVILGEAFVRSWAPFAAVFACVLGAIIYRFTISIALEGDVFGLTTSDLNLISSIVVTAAFLFTKYSRQKNLTVKVK